MAPKKTDLPQKAKKTKKRTPKERPVKPKLKTPSVIKIQIQRTGSSILDSKLIGRKVTSQQHFDLANAVIQAQLTKPLPVDNAHCTPVDNIMAPPPENTTIKKRAPRKRKPTLKQLETESDTSLVTHTMEGPTPKRKRKSNSSPDTPLANLKAIQNLEMGDIKKKPGPKSRTTIDTQNVAYVPVIKLPDNLELKRNKKPAATPKAKRVRNGKQKKISDFFEEGKTDEVFMELEDIVKPTPKKAAKNKPTPKKVAEKKDPKNPPAVVKTTRGRPKFVTERTDKSAGRRTKGKALNAKQIKDAATKLENAIGLNSAIPTRSTTPNSNHSNLSWIKDISSSSTTTCVTVLSDEVLKLDKKISLIPIKNADTKDAGSSSSDSGSSSASELEETDITSRPELNLSTSSMSIDVTNTRLLSTEIEKLADSMKRFELVLEKYIPSAQSGMLPMGGDGTPLDILAIACTELVKLFEDIDPEESPVEFAKPIAGPSEPVSVTPPTIEKDRRRSSGSSETFTSDNYSYVPFEMNDDEDTLSLFAESITGIESSKMSSASVSNVGNVHVHDAYVPEPKNPVQEKYTYRPTKIGELPKTKIVCEKQNADSTSISKEIDTNKIPVPTTSEEPKSTQSCEVTQPVENPRTILFTQHAVNIVKSCVYRGVCFFNIASFCKLSIRCRFPHIELHKDVIQNRISSLSEEALIQEYLLTRRFPILLRKHGLIFVTECLRRASTRIIVEMAIDFCRLIAPVSRQDREIRVAALELTLLHLNQVCLDACDDLLKHKVDDKNLLCHVLLRCMSESQNFARFNSVFKKLVAFLSEIGKPADLDVVGKVLERVCILDDESLARAMLNLIRNTDPAIFNNEMMETFEVYLSNLENGVVYAEYQSCKMAVGAMPAAAPPTAPPPPGEAMRPHRERYTSPDTTNLDGLKKELPPMITRTVDFTQPSSQPVTFKSPLYPAPRRHYTRGANWRNMGHGPVRPVRGHWPGMSIDRRVVYRNPPRYGNGGGT